MRHYVSVLEKKVTEEDRCINNYNPLLLLSHPCNVDVQVVCNSYEAACYTAKYVSKREEGGVFDTIQQVLAEQQQVEGHVGESIFLRRVLFSCASKLSARRTQSMQEVLWRLLGFPLRQTSRSSVYVNVDPPSKRRVNVPRGVLNDPEALQNFLHLSAEGVATHKIHSSYSKRPESKEEQTLFQFAAGAPELDALAELQAEEPERAQPEPTELEAELDAAQQEAAELDAAQQEAAELDAAQQEAAELDAAQQEAAELEEPEAAGDDVFGHIPEELVCNKKAKIVVWKHVSPVGDPEGFAYAMLLLHHPWRREVELLEKPSGERFETAVDALNEKRGRIIAALEAEDAHANLTAEFNRQVDEVYAYHQSSGLAAAVSEDAVTSLGSADVVRDPGIDYDHTVVELLQQGLNMTDLAAAVSVFNESEEEMQHPYPQLLLAFQPSRTWWNVLTTDNANSTSTWRIGQGNSDC
jgi:hypothetical protein